MESLSCATNALHTTVGAIKLVHIMSDGSIKHSRLMTKLKKLTYALKRTQCKRNTEQNGKQNNEEFRIITKPV